MFSSSKIAILSTLLLAASTVIAAPVDVELGMEKRKNHGGQATWFEVGLGACGWNNVNSDMVVAMNSAQFKSGGNCGQWLTITNTANGKTVVAQQVDECPTCDNGSLDMSPTLFQDLAGDEGLGQGVFPISWHFNKR